MSLDVYLDGAVTRPAGSGIFIRENGETREISKEECKTSFPGIVLTAFHDDEYEECYSRNVTHNLTKMADAAGIYDPLWRPDAVGITHAKQLIESLTVGLELLRAEPNKFKALNPPNGWGDYDGFVAFVADYLEACKANPEAKVRVSR